MEFELRMCASKNGFFSKWSIFPYLSLILTLFLSSPTLIHLWHFATDTLSVVLGERLVHQANEIPRSFLTHLKRGEDTLQALICYLRQAALKGRRVCSICSQTMLDLTFQMWEGKDTTTDSLNRKHKEMSLNDLASSSVPRLWTAEGCNSLENVCGSLLTPKGKGEMSRC